MRLFLNALFAILLTFLTTASQAQEANSFSCGTGSGGKLLHRLVNALETNDRFGRTLCSEIVAMDQSLVYNRFGSFNPFGMMYALRREVVPVSRKLESMSANDCDGDLGIAYHTDALEPGQVRLRDCKRPRPLTIRANVGDILHIRLTNMLREEAPGFSESFCKETGSDQGGLRGKMFHLLRQWVSEGSNSEAAHDEVSCKTSVTGSPGSEVDGNWPRSRGANLAIQGLTAFDLGADGKLIEAHPACTGLGAITPGASVDCYYMIEREGPFFMASTGAPSGGQGDGGSLTHGLFGAVMAEPTGSSWYRSQVSKGTFDKVWNDFGDPDANTRHARDQDQITDMMRYEHPETDPVSGQKMPVLNMVRAFDEASSIYEIVHSDLNAIVKRSEKDEAVAQGAPLAFREFSVFFHDELKTFYTRNFEELGDFGGGQLAGVRDGFAINYGASGMGDMLLANRKGIGPSANCQECFYEEFFLSSWANGDPALLEQYSDDPSNVHHSYLNDPVVFRNFHAGPKETHVFHLHAHQWFTGNDEGRGAYLDSQTVAPQQGFTYDIYGGGLEVYHKGQNGEKGWYETLGSGNRNRTPGDSIFHCHLYPHFAQGMWELWRVHDVLEDGSRKLPDGQWEPTLSLAEMNAATRSKKRPGSVDAETGRWIESGPGLSDHNIGTPIPAIVPLPGTPWPVLPTYSDGEATLVETEETVVVKTEPLGKDEKLTSFAGYPFYIGGKPGHRPPQAPMDIARELAGDNVTNEYLDGGLPRHVVGDATERALPFDLPQNAADRLKKDPPATNLASALNNSDLQKREALQSQVIASALALGDLTMKLKKTRIELLEYDGTPIERTGMGFHNDGKKDGSDLRILQADGNLASFLPESGGYESLGSGLAAGGLFTVNGAPPKPGAPFADPCGAPTQFGKLRRVDAFNYEFETNAGSFPVFTVAAGLPMAGSTKATDAEATNWVEYRRTDIHPNGPPKLFYHDGTTNKEIEPTRYIVNESDPFLRSAAGETRFTPDPAVVGYRRYEASAVQVDMITNRAGWHDPQARINVLTKNSGTYKDAKDGNGKGKLSPYVTASEEPFFFRALSGECIEFRHTNELPKELELDDFQVKTPTDTIGQHIHLVKFDVTASDGSGNGFNYEDGTFAPGEIAARICTAKNDPTTAPLITGARGPGERKIREFPGLCAKDASGKWVVSKDFDHKIWTFNLHKDNDIGGKPNRQLFQTTTQRWFADPILSATRAPDDINGDPGLGEVDRTLRTVFSHDHFGPSSIQQHGFYTALLIEPQKSKTCEKDATGCTPLRVDRELVVAGDIDIGARKVIYDFLPTDVSTPDEFARHREFALSIADFALLYDPRNSRTAKDVERTLAGDPTLTAENEVPMKGIMTLACEALYGRKARAPGGNVDSANKNMREICGADLAEPSLAGHWAAGVFNPTTGEVEVDNASPAWIASARPGDDPAHADGMETKLFHDLKVKLPNGTMVAADEYLKRHLIDYRTKAAGFDPADRKARLSSPVSPPSRPESISVDHHDPYLINYRGEPFPLRLGSDSSLSSDCNLKVDTVDWEGPLSVGVTEKCEISRQRPGERGDFANVMLTKPHGEPATPILNTHDSDPVQVRLIQGAQEVQHTFVLEGYNWPRNVDQTFPSDAPLRDDVMQNDTLVRACGHTPGVASMVWMAKAGRPDQYKQWALQGSASFSGADQDFWEDMDHQIANCFNTDGRVAAQEIGISEHFEFKFGLFHDSNLVSLDTDIFVRNLRTVLSNGERGLLAISPLELVELLQFRREILVRSMRTLDTPYHFGTQDALWNGAWGLVRVEPPNSTFFVRQRAIASLDFYIERLMRNENQTLDDLERSLREEFFKDDPERNFDLRRELRLLLLSPLDTIVDRLPEVTLDKRLRLDPRNQPDGQQGPRPDNPLIPLERFDALNADISNLLTRPLVQRDEPRRIDRRLLLQRKDETRKDEKELYDSLRDGDARLFAKRYPKRLLEVPEYEQVAGCPAWAPNVYTAIVAIESETVFGNPTRYSPDLYDQDGLFFALVDPRELLNPSDPESVSDTEIEDRNNWTAISLSTVTAAIQKGYAKPEPLVVNVKAGDCVFVVMLNALKTQKGKNPGLVDHVGDAPMPGITSLNVERDWKDILDEADLPHEHHADSDRKKDAMPSARLAVTFPLPVVTSQRRYARPFGNNPAWSLAGIEPIDDPVLSINDHPDPYDKTRFAQIEQFRFYAGLGFADRRWMMSSPLIAAEQAPEWDFLAALSLDNKPYPLPAELAQLPLPERENLGDTLLNLGKQRINMLQSLDRNTFREVEPRESDVDNYKGAPVVDRSTQTAISTLLAQRSTLSAKDEPTLTDDQALAVASRIAFASEEGGDIIPLSRFPVEIRRELSANLIELITPYDDSIQELLGLGIDLRIIRQRLVPEFKPYAFGALPLKSFGDFIGHPSHGLIGAITVVPENTTSMGSRAPRVALGKCLNPQILPNAFDFDRGDSRPYLRLDDLGPILPNKLVERVKTKCDTFVIVPEKNGFPVWNAALSLPDEERGKRTIRQFTLFWQDGLNLRDKSTMDENMAAGTNAMLVEDCEVCDDSYDWGDKGVSYVSEPFNVRLRDTMGTVESHYSLNNQEFGTRFFPLKGGELPSVSKARMPVLRVEAGEEIVVHVVHPGGRARQRAFATIGQDYDDLFPDFGFPRGALLAPGKAITASMLKTAEPGCYLWFDGPLQLRSGGVWGLLDIVPQGEMSNRKMTSCARN